MRWLTIVALAKLLVPTQLLAFVAAGGQACEIRKMYRVSNNGNHDFFLELESAVTNRVRLPNKFDCNELLDLEGISTFFCEWMDDVTVAISTTSPESSAVSRDLLECANVRYNIECGINSRPLSVEVGEISDQSSVLTPKLYVV